MHLYVCVSVCVRLYMLCMAYTNVGNDGERGNGSG